MSFEKVWLQVIDLHDHFADGAGHAADGEVRRIDCSRPTCVNGDSGSVSESLRS